MRTKHDNLVKLGINNYKAWATAKDTGNPVITLRKEISIKLGEYAKKAILLTGQTVHAIWKE